MESNKSIINIVKTIANPNKINVLRDKFGEVGYNYTNSDGIQITLKDGICEEDFCSDIHIEFIGNENNPGGGYASKELDRILGIIDKHNQSVSIEANAAEARADKSKPVTTMGDNELMSWYERRGFNFFDGYSYGYRYTKSYRDKMSKTKYIPKTYTAKKGEIDPEKVIFLDDDEFNNIDCEGIPGAFYSKGGMDDIVVYFYDETLNSCGGGLIKVDNVLIHRKFSHEDQAWYWDVEYK